MTLITHRRVPRQEGAAPVGRAGPPIARELYLALVIDRETRRVVIMASTEGGMDIEEVADKHPEKILKVAVDPAVGLMPFQGRQLAFASASLARR